MVQKRVVCTKLNIYVFITPPVASEFTPIPFHTRKAGFSAVCMLIFNILCSVLWTVVFLLNNLKFWEPKNPKGLNNIVSCACFPSGIRGIAYVKILGISFMVIYYSLFMMTNDSHCMITDDSFYQWNHLSAYNVNHLSSNKGNHLSA
jgi:hypothetical protein